MIEPASSMPPAEPTLETLTPQSQSALRRHFHKYQALFNRWPQWMQILAVGGGLFVVLGCVLGVYALTQSGSSSQVATSPTPSPTVTATPTPTPTPSESPVATPPPSGTPKPSATPKPTTTPKPSTTVTPTPTTKTYVLNWSEGNMTTTVNGSYAVYALLKYDGKTVTDQKNVKYTWTVADSSIADATPFAACIDGIQEPCPEDHATIKGKKEGNTSVTVKANWKDSGAFIDDVTIQIKIQGGTPTPSPTPSAPPQMSITFPTEGQSVQPTSSGQICVTDVPQSNTQGLQRRQNINNSGWTSYQNHTTLCFNPVTGSNTLQLQYRNSGNLESTVFTIHFTYGT